MVQEYSITTPQHNKQIIDIGDGLIMRWSTAADTENVADLVGDAFRYSSFGDTPEGETPGKFEPLMCCVRRLLSGHSLAMSEYDYALVENTRAAPGENPIVACAALHEIPSYYGPVKMIFGKPEQIACKSAYRNRGLVRKLMLEMIHPESERRGHLIQYMPGIDYFYRLFGYEWALSSSDGRELSNLDDIPKLEEGEEERYILRPATLDDIPYLIRLSSDKQCLFVDKTEVGSIYDERYWKYFVHGIYQPPQISWYDHSRVVTIIHDTVEKRDIGFNQHLYMNGLGWQKFALERDIAMRDVIYPVLRQMITLATEQAAACHAYEMSKKEQKKKGEEKQVTKKGEENKDGKDDDKKEDEEDKAPEISAITLELSQEHPALEFLQSKFDPLPDEPDAMLYARIPDYAAFVNKVAPALEARIARSTHFKGITATVQLHFYRKVEGMNSPGLEIVFEQGRLVRASPWKKPTAEEQTEQARKRIEEEKAAKEKAKDDSGKSGTHTPASPSKTVYSAQFYPLVFSQLLMGSRSVRDLIWSNVDNKVADAESRLFLDVLFPKVEHDFDLLIW
ncbi:hypothetical protein BGZ73_004158 [Actinomortierella ambigua]|nr:hypothetical protein BGZ73_004158 [Actinomortierella ambigua]